MSDSNLDDKGKQRRAIITGAGLIAAGWAAEKAGAAEKNNDDLRFPGEDPSHKVVYQLNKAEPDYQEHILFSAGAVLRHYGDNVRIVIVAIGPGLHILAKKPKRPVAKEIQQRVSSLHEYGVKFHACGNTMKSLNWTMDDMVPFAEYVEVGAVSLIELQEQGYSYISW